MGSLTEIEQLLGHTFSRKALLKRALTHSSLPAELAAEHAHNLAAGLPANGSREPDPESDNEQLEFLGDAVLGLLVAATLYNRFPELNEGELTRLRANLVSRRHLGQVGATLDLGRFMRLGKGEERSGGRKKAALLANCMEAVMGALYLDAGLEGAGKFVERTVVAPFAAELRQKLHKDGVIGDHKSACRNCCRPGRAVRHNTWSREKAAPTIASASWSKYESPASRPGHAHLPAALVPPKRKRSRRRPAAPLKNFAMSPSTQPKQQ